MLRFKKASAKNYLSIGEVELDLDNQGLVLIEGINDANETFQSNGSGKSTLLSIVTYALYGTTPNGLTADAVINRTAKKNMEVCLDFEKDGSVYRIERYRKHKTHKNTTKFYQDGVDLTQASVAKTNEKILTVFGIDYITYMNSIMYGQGDVEIFAKTTDKGKKQILENLADIGIYRYAQDVAKEKAKEALALATDFALQVTNKERELAFVDESYQRALADYENTAQSIKLHQDNVDRLVVAIEKAHSATIQEQARVTKELQDATELVEKASGGAEVDAELTTQLSTAKDNLSKLKTAQHTLSHQVQLNKTSLSKVENETNCYVCGAPLNAEHREMEMTRLNGELTVQEEKLAQIENAIVQYDTIYNDLLVKYTEAQSEARELNSNYQQLVNTRYAKERELANVGTKLEQLTNELDYEHVTLKALKAVTVPKLDKQKKEQLAKEKAELEQKSADQHEEAEQYKVLADEVFSNKGIRSDVLDLVTPFLNERANKYLAILSGSDIEIRFSTQTETASGELKDKFDLEVINGSGGETYQANSAGEKKRIDLAISFAIQDLVQSKANIAVNLGLYDECFDGLDGIGCENVIKILKERQKEVSSIFVITHNENLKPLFESVITMKKENGSSFLAD